MRGKRTRPSFEAAFQPLGYHAPKRYTVSNHRELGFYTCHFMPGPRIKPTKATLTAFQADELTTAWPGTRLPFNHNHWFVLSWTYMFSVVTWLLRANGADTFPNRRKLARSSRAIIQVLVVLFITSPIYNRWNTIFTFDIVNIPFDPIAVAPLLLWSGNLRVVICP